MDEKLLKIILAVQNGDKAAFEALYTEYSKRVYFLALKTVGNKENAEEVTQDVFLYVHRKIAELKDPQAFPAWLGRITASKCTDFLRKNNPFSTDAEEIAESEFIEETTPSFIPEKSLENAATAQILIEIIDKLPLPQRVCIYYYYYEQLSVREIAEQLAIQETTVRNRLALARDKIRKELEQLEKDEGLKLYSVFPWILFPLLKLAADNTAVPQGILTKVLDGVTSVIETAADGIASVTETATDGVVSVTEAAVDGIAAVTETATAGTATTATTATAGTATATAGTAATAVSIKAIAAVIAGVIVTGGITAAVLLNQEDIPVDVVTPEIIETIPETSPEPTTTPAPATHTTTTPMTTPEPTTTPAPATPAPSTNPELTTTEPEPEPEQIVVIDLSGRGITDAQLREMVESGEIPSDVTILNLGAVYNDIYQMESQNFISDISPLSGLTNLTSLLLDYNSITDISSLSGLTNLINLSLSFNQITDISPLSGLIDLTLLHLDFNHITDTSPLSGLTNLTYLSLMSNLITDISLLGGLTNLTSLLLASNQITDISPLNGLTNLTYLYLESNQITDISPLNGLTNLTYLYLGLNQIADISSLRGLTNLTSLSLYSNPITDWSPVAHIETVYGRPE
jgi:RNA polymerase sigma factor (sigma-70 family)